MLPSGAIEVYTDVSSHGQGTETTFAQIASSVMGVHPSRVQVRHSDTDQLPSGQGTYASRGLTVGGSAVYVGLQQVRRALMQLAAHVLECGPDDIVLQEGRAHNRHYPHQPLEFAQLATFAQEAGAPIDSPATYTLPENPYAFGAHLAVVEIDVQTGAVTCLRYVAVHDPGPLINPMLARGQIHGGIIQGIGQALSEEVVYSGSGQPLSASLMDYAAPRPVTCPEMIVVTLETPSTTNPLGINGVGELPTVAAPAAMANAVLDALAHRGGAPIDIPMTAEKVLRALHAQ